jgi:MFS transporter, PPP family, 3-phenylpropionic acid transporter
LHVGVIAPQTARRMPASPAVRLALFYAAIFIVYGIMVPFFPVWLAGRGMSATEIGTLLAFSQWFNVTVNPLAGIAADRWAGPRRIILLLGLVTITAHIAMAQQQNFPIILALACLGRAGIAAQMPLADNLALAAAYRGAFDYGRVRLWGSVSFILASLSVGRVLAGRDSEIILPLMIGAVLLLFFVSLGLPGGRAETPSRVTDPWALARPRFLMFLLAATLVQGSHSVFYGFSALHWRSLGLSESVTASLWSEGVVAEILLFYCSPFLLRRVGPIGLIGIGGAAGMVRWSITAYAAALPWLVAAQLLHALTFAAAHLGAMHHLARTLPSRQAATGQAVYGSIVGGIGALMLLSGKLYDLAGGQAYLAMAALAGLGAAACLPLLARAR